MGDLARDFTYAVRTLLRAPLLLLTTVLTLALGIGLSTGVFAVAYGVLLRPLPYADPSNLVVISHHWPDTPNRDTGVPLPDVDEWRRRARAFERIAGHSDAEFTLRGPGEPRSIRGAMVTDDFFPALGVPAAEGSTDAIAGATPAAAFSRTLSDQLGPGARFVFCCGAAGFSSCAAWRSASPVRWCRRAPCGTCSTASRPSIR